MGNIEGEKMRIALFGAGNNGVSFYYEYIKKRKSSDDIICFIDNDEKKIGKFIDGIPIVSIVNAVKLNVDLYIICSQFEFEIKKQLKENGIDDIRIKISRTNGIIL